MADTVDGFDRYVVIHGHFYQPPRENPWIEEVERQDGAEPYHDWNEAITEQCYLPNIAARVIRDGLILDLVNNYSYLSFNIGPTLMAWLERHYRDVYDAIVEADRTSRSRNGGHGNAIAQAYNHVILPLENERDKRTQVLWGLGDFRHRFGRDPEALWLPETACNFATLAVLIEHGLRYVILAPSQAEKTRPLAGGPWHDVSKGDIDPRKPYRHFLTGNDGRRIGDRFVDVFFYDGPLSREIAFGSLTNSAHACAERILRSCGSPDLHPVIVNLAADGETFGHHRPHSEMCLAYLCKYELIRHRLNVVNYARYLDLRPTADEVVIKMGPNGEGTSWSCAHGVGRWKENCGCTTGRSDFHQKWRSPLRQAYRNLRDLLVPVFESEGGKLFHDTWRARNDYIDVILDRRPANVDAWLNAHLKVELTAQARVRSLRLLEMQRHALLMFTSCGWFFDELSRIETVQTMLYAARAAQLASQVTGQDLERKLKDDLAAAPGNLPALADGRTVYEKLVEPSKADSARIVAQYAITSALIPANHRPGRIYSYSVTNVRTRWEEAGNWLFGVGRARCRSEVTADESDAAFFCSHLDHDRINCVVKPYPGDEEFERMQQRIMEQVPHLIYLGLRSIVGEYFGDRMYNLDDLFRDDRQNVISSIMRERTETLKDQFQRIFHENAALMLRYRQIGWQIPPELRIPSQHAEAAEVAERLQEAAADWDLARVYELKRPLEVCRLLGFELDFTDAARILQQMLMAELQALLRELNRADADKLQELLSLARELGIPIDSQRPQNLMFHLLKGVAKRVVEEGQAGAEGGGIVRGIIAAAKDMGFEVEAFRKVAGREPEQAEQSPMA